MIYVHLTTAKLFHTPSIFPVTPGDKVQLLLNSKRVGIGTVRTTNQLYGHHIPVNFVPFLLTQSIPTFVQFTCHQLMSHFYMLAS